MQEKNHEKWPVRASFCNQMTKLDGSVGGNFPNRNAGALIVAN